MEFTSHIHGTLLYVQSRWPVYLFGFAGGSVLAAGIIWLSALRGWYSFIVFGLASLIILTYFLIASLWVAHRLYDTPLIADTLLEYGQIAEQQTVVDIDLGRRYLAADLHRYMTTGRVIAIDIYNPQLTPSRTLARWRRLARRPDPDPRLSWRDGSITLLPLPDGSIPVVTLVQTISEFWQQGDQLQLLKEIHRIVMPGGDVLFAERVRTSRNIAVMGLAGMSLPRSTRWENLLIEAGFEVIDYHSLYDLICFIRAKKPAPKIETQLPLNI